MSIKPELMLNRVSLTDTIRDTSRGDNGKRRNYLYPFLWGLDPTQAKGDGFDSGRVGPKSWLRTSYD